MRTVLFTVALLAAPRVALACPVCFGQSDSPLASAINLGVVVMLGVVATVLSSFGAFIIYLNRRARLAGGFNATSADIGRSPLSTTAPQEGIAQC